MAEPVKKDDALAIAVREAFQRHMENARLAALVTPAPEAVSRIVDVKPQPQPQPKPVDHPPPEPVKAKSGGRGKGTKSSEPNKSSEPHKSSETKAAHAEVTLREARLEPPHAANSARQASRTELTAPPAQRPSTAPAMTLPAIAADQGNRPPAAAPRSVVGPSIARDLSPSTARRQTPPLPSDGVAEEILARREAEWLQARTSERAGQAVARPVAVERQARELVQRQRERPPSLPVPEDLDVHPLPQSGRDPVGRTRPQAHFGTHKPDDAVPARNRRPGRPANTNAAPAFGSGKRRGALGFLRWALPTLGAFGVMAAIGGGAYFWMANRPVAVAALPLDVVASPEAVASTSVAPPAATAMPAIALPTATATATQDAEVPTRSVKTVTITLDEIDMAVQDAHDKFAYGDIEGARKGLEPYRAVGDARALVALAETFDPSLVRNPALADAKQAQQLYEAAGKAGFKGSAERVAKVQQAQLAN